MKFRSGLMLTLSAGLVLGGCAAGAAGEASGPAGATGIRPRETEVTRRAQVLLLQNQYQQALDAARGAVTTDSTNARLYVIIGDAQAGLNNFTAADSAFDRAVALYPTYESEVLPRREQAWGAAFNEGVTAYNANNIDGAIQAWERANQVFTLRPEAYQNLAALYTQRGDYDRAITAYQGGIAALRAPAGGRTFTAEETTARAETLAEMEQNLGEILLFTERFADAERLYRQRLTTDSTNFTLQTQLAQAIARQAGREAEAQQIYNRLLATPNLTVENYHDIGVALFLAKDYPRAIEALGRVAAARQFSRDAVFNHANALYAASQWQPLLAPAERLVQLDPLHQDSYYILARAQREARQNTQALATLQRAENLPIHLTGLELSPGNGRVTVRGTVNGNVAPAGSPVNIRFTFFDANGQQLGTQTATVNAPAKDATAALSVVFETTATVAGYSYQLAQ